MKRNLLISLFALILFANNVKAETLDLGDVTETGQNVTVGEVDVPVYSVDITWGDMSFDYKYNPETKDYYWQVQKGNTSQVANPGTIEIIDSSKNGSIIPSVSWTSEDDYDFVDGKIYYEGPICTLLTEDDFELYRDNPLSLYTDSNCTTHVVEENPVYKENHYYAITMAGWKELQNNKIPEEGNVGGMGLENGWYYVKIELENNPTKEATMPTPGDKIGTVTISIEAK